MTEIKTTTNLPQNKQIDKFFSRTLFKQTWKSNRILLIIMSVILCLMILITSAAMPGMISKMTPAMVDRLILQYGSIAGFIMNMAYTQIGIMLVIIYVVITANSLIASQVDRGSMAYTLSTPIKRTTVAITQMFYLLIAIFVMILLSSFSVLIGWNIGKAKVSSNVPLGTINISDVALISLGFFLAMSSIGSISFIASCTFNLSKFSFALGAGLPAAFYLFSMLANMGTMQNIDILTYFKYLSLLSCFDVKGLASHSVSGICLSFIVYPVVSVCLYTGGIIIFKQKDLPL